MYRLSDYAKGSTMSPLSIGSPGSPMSVRSSASDPGSVMSGRSVASARVASAVEEVRADSAVGVAESAGFNSALWAYTARMDSRVRENCLVDGNVGEVKSMARHVKMLSMNPSIYGNKYGVLGSS